MALLPQCLKLQRERKGAPAEDTDFPPIDAETLWAVQLVGLQIEGGSDWARDTVRELPRIRVSEPGPA
jgi:hypothetical protein